jgi:hypothetical protein
MSLLALAFSAAGIGLFVQHVMILQTWRPVEATIVRSEVIGFRNNKQRSMYRGEVDLAYTVGGQSYQTPDTFQHASSSEGSIRRQMATTYAVGTRHRVFFDPGNPYALRWDVGINFSFFLLPLVFTGIGLILIGVCYFLWRLPYPPRLACRRCGNEGKANDRFCPRCGEPLAPVNCGENELAANGAAREELAERPGDVDDVEIAPAEPPRGSPAGLLLAGTFFALPGIACLIGAVYLGLATYGATQTWPTAAAIVTSSGIETSRSHDGTPTYRLTVEFVYGEQHSERAASRSIYASASYPWIVRRLAHFPTGSRHTIRINPRDGADVRFDLESSLLNWLPASGLGLFGFLFAAVGGSLLRWGFKPRCTSCRHQLRRGAVFCTACSRPVDAKGIPGFFGAVSHRP